MAQTFLNLAQGVTGNLNLATNVTGTLSTSNYVQGGITEYDQWRINGTTNLVGNGTTTLTSDFERNDTDFDKIGTGMSESSGVFTFGATGVYQIIYDAFFRADGGARPMIGAVIQTTTDNSNYNNRAFSYTSGYTSEAYASSLVICGFDVTNTSTHKVRFRARHGDTTNIQGSTTSNYTCFTFTRLGST